MALVILCLKFRLYSASLAQGLLTKFNAMYRLRVRRGGVRDALMKVASQPVLLAGLAGIWLSASGMAMPRMVCQLLCHH